MHEGIINHMYHIATTCSDVCTVLICIQGSYLIDLTALAVLVSPYTEAPPISLQYERQYTPDDTYHMIV